MPSKVVITITDEGNGFMVHSRSHQKTATPEEAKMANKIIYWITQIIEKLGGETTKIEEVKDE